MSISSSIFQFSIRDAYFRYVLSCCLDTAFNSLFEMHSVYLSRLGWALNKTFQFSIRDAAVERGAEPEAEELATFNSLFEMPSSQTYRIPSTSLYCLSILYSRCASRAAPQRSASRRCCFQFSIRDAQTSREQGTGGGAESLSILYSRCNSSDRPSFLAHSRYVFQFSIRDAS